MNIILLQNTTQGKLQYRDTTQWKGGEYMSVMTETAHKFTARVWKVSLTVGESAQ